MKLFLFLLLCGVIHQNTASYLRKSELCRPWMCIIENLGLDKNDLIEDNLIDIFSYLLPSDTWQKEIPTIIDECHREITSGMYRGTCPGQSMLHCFMNQLVDRCPEKYKQQHDACTPVSSLAGFKHMFSQSRYEHFDQTIPYERRPVWFLKNYFSKACCNIPQLFNNTILEKCGFSTMMKYYDSKPVTFGTPVQTLPSNSLECCDLSGFIEPSDYNQCQFNLKWHGADRFHLNDVENKVETVTPPNILMNNYDVQVIPLSCDVEECIFKSLQIVAHTGQVDLDAFSKLLDNYTRDHPEWISAKARVVTTCLSKPITDYTADCEINKILACTLDVLSENCPYNKNGTDPCRHKNAAENMLCQTSSSGHRPKRRRQLCDLPPLIKNINHVCGYNYYALNKVSRPVRLTQKLLKNTASIKRFLHYKPTCLQTSESAKCVMSKLGLLNKYGFMDYFRTKARLNTFTDGSEWTKLKNVYVNTFYQSKYYKQHCTSQKKLLNILDSMIMTCPLSKRNNSPQCQYMFNQTSVQPRSTEIKQLPFTNVFFGRSRPQTYVIRIPFSRSFVPATWENSNLNVDPILFKNFHQTTTPKGERPWEIKGLSKNSSSPLILLPVYMREPRKHEVLP